MIGRQCGNLGIRSGGRRLVVRVGVSLLVTGIALVFAPASWAYCSEPSPPSRYSKPDKPEPPSRPYCAATQSCSEWQVRSYNSELEQYRSDLREYESDVEDYVRKLKAYVDDAVEYAKCEIRDLDD